MWIRLVLMTALGLAVAAPAIETMAEDKSLTTAKQSKRVNVGARREVQRAPHRGIVYPRVGRQVRTLPRNHRRIRVGRDRYHYHNGAFYRPRPHSSYVVVHAPLGARVRHLPPGYIGFHLGPRRYGYVNFTYYLWDRRHEEYVVVDEPEGAPAAVVAASQSSSTEVFVYPSEGQTDDQRDRDRYECYVWAVEQTGFDPSESYAANGSASDYRRAISACLEGRGYTVK